MAIKVRRAGVEVEVVPGSLGNDVIEIRSTSNPNVVYRVDVVNGRCSCPAWKFSRNGSRICKHLKAMGIKSYQNGSLKFVAKKSSNPFSEE